LVAGGTHVIQPIQMMACGGPVFSVAQQHGVGAGGPGGHGEDDSGGGGIDCPVCCIAFDSESALSEHLATTVRHAHMHTCALCSLSF
jgi:hypothetical protein